MLLAGDLSSQPFVIGANLPWVTYGCDFGTSAWHRSGGLASRRDIRDLTERLRGVAASGVELLRWFLFCDGRSGVQFDGDGTPAGIDDRVAPDVDTALDLAEGAGLRLLPTLLDFHWCKPRRRVHGVDLGGHHDTIRDAAKRDALLARVIAPLLRRYGAEPSIAAWDLMNEPEWVTLGLGTWNPFAAVEQADMHAFLGAAVAMVRTEARQPVTVGSASAAWLPFVADLGLDFYQPHWYDHCEPRMPLATPVSALGMDRPVVLGEFPSRGSAHDLAGLLDTVRAAGYAGAFVWSILATDTASDFASVASPLAAWVRQQGSPNLKPPTFEPELP